MSRNSLEVKTQIKILKPVNEVFEAIVNPQKMSNYFISLGSERLEIGKMITWTWSDVGKQLSIKVNEVKEDKYISFFWSASGSETLVEILLSSLNQTDTIVKISESSWSLDENGIACFTQQTQGWMHMLCCMKAFLEYGINLRKDKV